MEKLEADVALIRTELSDLQSLKTEVRRLQSAMVNNYHLDSKIQEIQASMDKSLSLVLQSIKPSTPMAHPTPPVLVTTGEKPTVILTSVQQPSSVAPLNLQPVFDQSKISATDTTVQNTSTAPNSTQIPVAQLSVPMGAPVYSDSTKTCIPSQDTATSAGQFRLSSQSIPQLIGLPLVMLQGKPPPMPFTGNTGFYAPIIAPRYIPPTYNHITR